MNLTPWMKTDFCRHPVKQSGNSIRGSGNPGWGQSIPTKRQNMPICDRWIWKLFAVFVVAACAVIHGQSAPRPRIDPGLATLGGGVSGTAHANGTTLHYVRGRTGPAIISAARLPPKTRTSITASCRYWRSILRLWQLICAA